MFSAMRTWSISSKTDFECHFYSDLEMAPFPPQQIWHFTLFAMQTCPISTTTNFEIHLIKNCNPVCPLSFQTHVAILFSGIQTCLISTTRDLEIQILLKSGVPNFHQNRLANSIFSTMWTCPSSCQPDFEIHRFLQSGVPNFNSNRFGNSFFWYPDIPHFHPIRCVNSLF